MRFTNHRIRTTLTPMKTQIKNLIVLITLLTLTACYRNDIRTETFQIDQLRSEEAQEFIAAQFKNLDGIQKVTSNYDDHTLTVVFNGRAVFLKNIESAIVKAGFSLPHWPADPKDTAKLPKELQ
jgi:copper chaperone CopZ